MINTQEVIKYDVTYHLGNTVVHVVAPLPMTEDEKEEILLDFYNHAWSAWNSLSIEERLKINSECDLK
jgi:hypothetical protein